MINKTTILFFVFFLLVLPFVHSEKIEIQEFTGVKGIEIKYPIINSININEGYNFHFHIFNLSDGQPIISGVSCYFHLYNSTGDHIYIENEITTPNDKFDYEFSVSGTNFSKEGDYSFIFQCNSTARSVGGFVNEFFIVKDPNNFDDSKDATAGIYLMLFVLISAFMFLLLPFFKEEFSKTEWTNLVIKKGLWALGLVLMALNAGIMKTIMIASNIPLNNEMILFINIFGWSAYLMSAYMVLSGLIKGVELAQKNNEKARGL